ncbi:MAG: 2-oxoglutarate dehydrogenase complex dihydrolipoyllysine-residue succinyltransferase [Acidobacteria bacterium]|nr:2-oxoglutarate dehydrogenase complex dihydrolipoyllysine-residue succinyltransferase [Acidobacteriota bacterium]
MTYEVRIPEIGESVTEALIIRWIKQPGEAIGRDDPIVELETDKVTVEMPSPVAGVLSEIVCAEGETVPIGAVIARIEEGAVAASAQPAPAATAAATGTATAAAQGDLLAGTEAVAPPATPAPPAPAVETAAPAPAQAAEAQPAAAEPQGEEAAAADDRRILPAARRLIAEHDLDASLIPATGKGGRLLKSDVAAWLAAREAEPEATPPTVAPAPTTPPAPTVAQPAPAPTPDAPAAAPPPAGERAEERVPMTPIRRRIAERLVQSQQQAALLTTFNEIDMSAVIDFRKRYRDTFVERHEVRLGFLSFFVKAAVDALRRFPRLNAEISGTDIIYRNYYDIGIAVSTDRGLMVPVLRSAERLSFAEIESRIGDFAGRAREGRIRIEELQGGTFTITNGGIFGSLLSTPIINPPQSGVLGLHAIQDRPMVVDGEIVVRPMMYVALTYDHRIVDGREAVSFLVRIKEAIQEPARMLIEV